MISSSLCSEKTKSEPKFASHSPLRTNSVCCVRRYSRTSWRVVLSHRRYGVSQLQFNIFSSSSLLNSSSFRLT